MRFIRDLRFGRVVEKEKKEASKYEVINKIYCKDSDYDITATTAPAIPPRTTHKRERRRRRL